MRVSARAAAGVFVCVLAVQGQLRAQGANGPQAAISEGVQLLRAGRAQEAKARFDAALRVAPRSAEALTWRGVAENSMAQYGAAAKDFRAALRVDPSLLSAHYNLALSLIRLKETDAAIAQLRVVVAAQPAVVPPRYNLGVLLEGKGTMVEAAREFGEAHRLAPGDVEVTLHLLTASLRLRKGEELEALVESLGGEGVAPQAQREAGTALLEAGHFAEASGLFDRARTQEPGAGGVDLLLARSLLGEGKNAQAIALLESLAGGVDDKERTYLLALAYAGAGQMAQAADGFRAAAKLDPGDPRPLYHLGLIAVAAPGGGVEAARLLREAMQLDPGNLAYSLALARVLLATDEVEQAKAVLGKVPVEEGGAERSALLGLALASTNGVAEAVPLLEKAVALDPSLALAHSVLGFCLFRQGRYAQAAGVYQRAAELEPRRLLYARDAAVAFERAGKGDVAQEYAERAVSLPGAGAGDHALLGKLYTASGRREDAIRELRLAAEMDPELDAPVYLLARTYQQMGDRTQATEWSAKLAALKQRHAETFSLEKKAGAAAIRSSALLQGGSLKSEDEGVQ